MGELIKKAKLKELVIEILILIVFSSIVLLVVFMRKGVEINFNNTVKDIEKYNNKNVNINCFISNLISKDGDFGYVTNTCYKSDIEDMADYDKVGESIAIYMEDNIKLETTQKVVNVRGKLKIANENDFDYVVVTNENKEKKIIAKSNFKGATKRQILDEYSDNIDYIYKDKNGKVAKLKIINAKLVEYNGKNTKILNYNKNVDKDIFNIMNNMMQQIYEKLNNNTYKINSKEFDSIRNMVKSQGKDVLGYEELNRIMNDIRSLSVEVKNYNKTEKIELETKVSDLYTKFSSYITKIKLEE